jgi:hypothetical protein
MAVKKNSDIEVDLLPSLQRGRGELISYPAVSTGSMATTRDGEYILQVAAKQELTILAHARKTVVAMQQAGTLQEHGGQVFGSTCKALDAIRQGARGSESEDYVDRFTHFQKDQLAGQLADLYSVGMGQIRHEVLSRLPTEAPKEKRQGLVARLFGG